MARICLVRQHYVPRDSRVAREIDALVAVGHEVDVVCLREPGQPAREFRDGVRYFRLPLRHTEGRAVGRYLAEYGTFFMATGILLAARQLHRRYRVVQVNSVPDVLVFSAIIPRLLGVPVLLDLQECMPEFLATKFSLSPGHVAIGALRRLEQWSIRFAEHVITPNELMRQTFIDRGADPAKITVVLDGCDPAVFSVPDRLSGGAGRTGFTLVSHGTVEEHYGLDLAVRAVAGLRNEIPGLRLIVFGSGSYLPALRQLVSELEVDDMVAFSNGFVPLPELVRGIAGADAGLVAIRRDAFRDLAFPGKIFDFVQMRKPVIASRTRSVQEILGPGCLELFESGDVLDLQRAIRRIATDAQRRHDLVHAAAEKSHPLQWSRQRVIYRAVLDRVLGHPV